MEEPVRLWRTWGDEAESRPFDTSPNYDYDEEYAALPRADFDALVKRAEEAERERDEARESAAAAWRLLDEHRNGCVWITWHKEAEERANAATARAEKAEAELRDARAATGGGATMPADPVRDAARALDRAATALSLAIVSDPGAVDSARTALYRAQDAFRDADRRAALDTPAAPTSESNASGGHEPRQGREEPTDDAR